MIASKAFIPPTPSYENTRTLRTEDRNREGRAVQTGSPTEGDYQTGYASGGRVITVTRPGGVTETTTYYRDAQLKNVIVRNAANAILSAEYHVYSVNDGSDAAYPAGSITETMYRGGNGVSATAHWNKTTSNNLGMLLREEEPSPETAVPVKVTCHFYNAKLQRVKTSVTGLADTVYEYDDFGKLVYKLSVPLLTCRLTPDPLASSSPPCVSLD
jgi:hypothetical protein